MDSIPENLNHEDPRHEIEAILAEYQHQKMLESLIGPLVSMVVHVTVVVFLVFFISLDQPSAAPEVSFTMKPAEEVKEADKPEPPEPPPDLEVPLIDMQAPATSNAPATSMTNFGDVGGASFTIPASGSPYKVRVPAGGGGAGFGLGSAGLGGGRGSSGNLFAGRFYDLKQTIDGRPTGKDHNSYYRNVLEEYVQFLCGLRPDSSLGQYYTANRNGTPITLYTSGFFVAKCSATIGPQCYGVQDQVKPAGWFAHYQAKMRVGRDMTFRFVGQGDDVLVVLVNRQLVLVGCWETLAGNPPSRSYLKDFKWMPTEDPNGTTWEYENFSPVRNGCDSIKFGNWVTVKKGDVIAIDVIAGEVPGGLFGLVLCIEEKGWKRQPDGRPKLALFSTVETLDDQLPAAVKRRVGAGHFTVNEGMLGLTSFQMFQERLASVVMKVE